GEDVTGGQDEVLLALDLDLGAAVLRVDDLVPNLDIHRDAVPLFEPAGPDGDDLALLRALLRSVGDDDAGRRRGFLLARLEDVAVHSSPTYPPSVTLTRMVTVVVSVDEPHVPRRAVPVALYAVPSCTRALRRSPGAKMSTVVSHAPEPQCGRNRHVSRSDWPT